MANSVFQFRSLKEDSLMSARKL